MSTQRHCGVCRCQGYLHQRTSSAAATSTASVDFNSTLLQSQTRETAGRQAVYMAAAVLYGAACTVGSDQILGRALAEQVSLPADAPQGADKESMMDTLAKNIMSKAPHTPNCKNSTTVAAKTLVAHLWNAQQARYLLITTPGIHNAVVEQLWTVMDAQYVRCRQAGQTSDAFQTDLASLINTCNLQHNVAVRAVHADQAQAAEQEARDFSADEDIVVRALLSICDLCRGKWKLTWTWKAARKCLGIGLPIFLVGLATTFALMACPLKDDNGQWV